MDNIYECSLPPYYIVFNVYCAYPKKGDFGHIIPYHLCVFKFNCACMYIFCSPIHRYAYAYIHVVNN